MTVQPLEELAAECVYTGGELGPYAGVETEDLVDALEHEYEQGRPFTAEIVFELAARALAAAPVT